MPTSHIYITHILIEVFDNLVKRACVLILNQREIHFHMNNFKHVYMQINITVNALLLFIYALINMILLLTSYYTLSWY